MLRKITLVLMTTLIAFDQLERLAWDQKKRLANQLQPGLYVKQVTVSYTFDGVTITPQTIWIASGQDLRH